MAEHDLTGIWQGLYSYGGIGLDVGFTATLIENAGALFGTTHETDPRLAPTSLTATVAGARAGLRVVFVKTYDAEGDAFLPISYEGRLSADGSEIEGTWAIRRASLAGRFLMSRPDRRTSARRARRAARV